MESQSVTTKPEIKSCAKCGASFECLHNESCWCMSIKISDENLRFLKEHYTNCLCPSCLNNYAVKTDK